MTFSGYFGQRTDYNLLQPAADCSCIFAARCSLFKARYSQLQPATAGYSQLQPATAGYSLLQPATATYSLLQPATSRYSPASTLLARSQQLATSASSSRTTPAADRSAL